MFGGEIIVKGFPTANGNGNSLVTNISLGISESSEHKEAAWGFVRKGYSEPCVDTGLGA